MSKTKRKTECGEVKEWLANEQDGGFPPGLWAAVGKYDEICGVYTGLGPQIVGFIPEDKLDKAIADLKLDDHPAAELIEGVRPDIADLRSGKRKLFMDMKGRRIR